MPEDLVARVVDMLIVLALFAGQAAIALGGFSPAAA